MKPQLRILHLEDLSTDAEMIARELVKGKIDCTINVVATKEKFIEALRYCPPDLILSDHTLGAFNSFEAIEIVKRASLVIPFILVTSSMTDDIAVNIMEMGAYDYILKDRLHRLPSAIKNSVQKFRLERERLATYEELTKKEARFRAAQAIAHLGNWELNFETQKTIWSDEAYRIYGLEPQQEEQSYESWRAFIHPDDLFHVMNAASEAQKTLSDHSIEHRIVLKNGQIRHIHADVRFEFDAKGKPVGLWGTSLDITERKIAEEEIMEMNEQYQLAAKATNDILWDWNISNNHIYRSENYLHHFGYPHINDDVYNDSWLYNVHPDDVDRVMKSLLEHINDPGKTTWSAEYRFFKSNGELVYIRDKGFIVWDDQKAYRMVGAMSDITEYKLIELKLIEEQNNLKLSQKIGRLGSWEMKMGSNQVNWSDEVCEIFGVSPDSNPQTYQGWLSHIHPEDLEEVLKETARARETSSESMFSYRICLQDGTIKHLLNSSKVNWDDNGNPLSAFGITQDITEIKTAEETLKSNEARLRQAEAIAKTGYWEIDLNNYEHIWSDEMYKMFGADKNIIQPSEQTFLSFIHQDEREYVSKKIVESFTTLKNSSFYFRLITTRGELKYGYSEWRFEFDKNRVPKRLFGIVKDVTETKLAEIERTRILDELVQRNKNLEQFTYIVSHNLRAPVANIIGAAAALNNPMLSAIEVSSLQNGLGGLALRLDEVVKDLNDVLEVRQHIDAAREQITLSELFAEVCSSINDTIEKDDVRINCDFSEHDSISTLKSYIYSIFHNLIINSIKYRRSGIPCIVTIKTSLQKNRLVLSFKDNGTGIDLEKNGGQIFGLYKRFHHHIEGKGIGLFMVKTQVESLGGKIAVISELNKGTEFRIEFEL